MHSKRLSTFFSKPDLSFFFLDECPLQSFSYWVQKSRPSLSLPSFSHISHPISPQILSAVLSQHVHNLATFHHLMSVPLVQTAPISLLDYCNSFLLAYSLALPSLFHILAKPIDYSPLLLKILHWFPISLVIKCKTLSDLSPAHPTLISSPASCYPCRPVTVASLDFTLWAHAALVPASARNILVLETTRLPPSLYLSAQTFPYQKVLLDLDKINATSVREQALFCFGLLYVPITWNKVDSKCLHSVNTNKFISFQTRKLVLLLLFLECAWFSFGFQYHLD